MRELSVRRPVPPRPSRPQAAVVIAAALVAVSGCQTGSWKPPSSWSMFGGSSKATGGLTDAPEYAQGPAKPSATASPYPTTSTPDAYVITDGGPAARTAAGAAPPAPTAVAAGGAVVYGSTPADSQSELSQARFAALPSGQASSPPAGAYGAQVGPYAPATSAVPLESPAAGPGFGRDPSPAAGGDRFGAAVESLGGGRGGADAPSGGFGPGPAGDPAARLGGERIPSGADPTAATPTAPPASGWQSPPTAAASPASFPSPPVQDSRYSTGSSRFSGLSGDGPAAADRGQAMVPQQSLPAFATESPTPATAANPALTPPAAVPAAAPGNPASFGAPPARRPDPGYRPGGTSSFQPRSTGAAGVQPAGFDAPLPN